MTARRALAAACLALVAALVPAPGAVAAKPAGCADAGGRASTNPASGQSASHRPVVLVHGWTGDPMTDTAKTLRQRLPGKISTFTFDYSEWASFWAADAHIAPCLADYLTSVSRAYTAAGGDGKVIVVAHSMGGLALRYAMDPASVAHPVAASAVPYVITLGTPHLGSPWGGQFVPRARELWQHLGHKALPPSSGMDGGKCLAEHTKGAKLPSGCGALPPWLPHGVTLTEIAGDVTVDRTLFGFEMYSIPLFSDGIVAVPSAHGYPVSGPGGTPPVDGAQVHSQEDRCEVGFDAVVTSAADLSFAPAELVYDYATLQDLQHDRFSPVVQGYLAGAFLTAPCAHGRLPTDSTAVNQTAALLKSEVDTLAKAQPTRVVTVVAVDRSGNPKSGYQVVQDVSDVEYCATSPSATGPDIVSCAPSAAGADICWVGPDRTSLLCGTKPWDKQLLRARSTTPIGSVAANPDAEPWGLVLADGARCVIRNGGAWGGRADGYTGAYSCDGGEAEVVLVPETGDRPAVNRASPAWTVKVGPLGEPEQRFSPPSTQRVVTAYFAGSP